MSTFWNCLSAAAAGGCFTSMFFEDWRKALGCALLAVGFAIAGADDEETAPVG